VAADNSLSSLTLSPNSSLQNFSLAFLERIIYEEYDHNGMGWDGVKGFVIKAWRLWVNLDFGVLNIVQRYPEESGKTEKCLTPLHAFCFFLFTYISSLLDH
jgi:hypothetical protein